VATLTAIAETRADPPQVRSEYELYTTRLDLPPRAVTALAELLSDDEQQRAARLVFHRDRARFIVGRARLRQLLGARLGVAPASIEFTYGARGKPALGAQFGDCKWSFNVSHSEDVAVYGFALDREIGVDVEAVRELPDAEEIAARCFSLRENAAYLALSPRDRPFGFFNCWTRKEAFIKAVGEGLSHPLERFDVSLAPGEPARILRVGSRAGEHCGWRVQSFSPAPGFVAAIVIEAR
jgi:4'-phosphopantetheinyl transferase